MLGLNAQLAVSKEGLAANVPLLTTAVAEDDDKVAAAAANALGDLCLLFGVSAVDDELQNVDGGVVGLLAASLDASSGRDELRASAGAALAKLVLCGRVRSAEEVDNNADAKDRGVHASAEHCVGLLLFAWASDAIDEVDEEDEQDARPTERLQQSLSVFFNAYARTGAAHHRVFGRGLLAPLRCALRGREASTVGRKQLGVLFKNARTFLDTPVAETMRGDDNDCGHVALARLLLAELMAVHAGTGRSKTVRTAYQTGLSGLLGALRPAYADASAAQEASALADAVMRRLGANARGVRAFRDTAASAATAAGLSEDQIAIVAAQADALADELVASHVEDAGAPLEEEAEEENAPAKKRTSGGENVAATKAAPARTTRATRSALRASN